MDEGKDDGDETTVHTALVDTRINKCKYMYICMFLEMCKKSQCSGSGPIFTGSRSADLVLKNRFRIWILPRYYLFDFNLIEDCFLVRIKLRCPKKICIIGQLIQDVMKI